MLYVFMVSSGTMKKFDMNLALKNVDELKVAIEKSVSIPAADQVLLCSGGEELKPHYRVGNYGAGTDTNPIFLFSKRSNDTELAFPSHARASSDLNIEYDVTGCADMAPSCEAATVRSNLAQRFAELAVIERKECDDLVHGQHLQQQGWAAVVANLEDAKDSLLKRKSHFDDLFQRYLENRSSYKEILKTFPRDIDLLSKIPLLPKLVSGIEKFECSVEGSNHTLLSWFCSEPRPVLESLAEKCQRSLEELNEHALHLLNNDVANILTLVDNPFIKGVRGIEERLFTLNKLIEDSKKIANDQRDLANWFTHTLNRINKDNSVLVDLCGTFQNQLELMLHNHKCLRDILERCTKAKVELCESLHARLKCICDVESQMYDLQVQLIFHEKHVKSVTNQIESFRQVHNAPQRYFSLLSEVCRRRSFSSGFMKWAENLCSRASVVYEKELRLRSSFNRQGLRNIVDDLFFGMEDMPPPFAIECPQAFDQLLPEITREDLETLWTTFPELAHYCDVSFSHKSSGSDSVFSSNVSSSRNIPNKEQKASPGEPPTREMFSLTSSPFEDCLLPSSETATPKHATSPLTEDPKKCSITVTDHEKLCVPDVATMDSDGEEFERVDKYEASPPIDVMIVPKAKTESIPKEAGEERFKVPDSLSQDFQSTEYFIDDSMPSSYTESNETSPLIRNSQMVKSHHVVVAELQRQVEEKNGALTNALSSLETSRCNVVKRNTTISNLRQILEEGQSHLRNDVSELRSFVKQGFQVNEVVDKINDAMVTMRSQFESEMEKLTNQAANLEKLHLEQLGVESLKLVEAQDQISTCEEQLREKTLRVQDLVCEKEQLGTELFQKNEQLKGTLLEHELELDLLRNRTRFELEEKNREMQSMKEALIKLDESVEGRIKEELKGLTERMESEVKEKQQCFDQKLREQESQRQSLRKELRVRERECFLHLADIQKRLGGSLNEDQSKVLERLQESSEETSHVEMATMEVTELGQTLKNLERSLFDVLTRWVDQENEKRTKLRQDHEEELEKLKSRYLVENQVSFNEAIDRVAKEKDAVIEELSSQIAAHVEKHKALKSTFDRYSPSLFVCRSSETESSSSLSRSASSSFKVQPQDALQKMLVELQREMEPLLQVPEAPESPIASAQAEEQLICLKKTKHDPTQASKPKCLECKNRVSILSCNPNDLVLLCYEEKHENFAVFSFGQFLHFLHADGLQSLDLKIPPGPSGKSWTLGVVLEKEFCVAKKAANRYKVDQGTRFYRVKVGPWTHKTLSLQKPRRRHPPEEGATSVHSPSSESAEVPPQMSSSAI